MVLDCYAFAHQHFSAFVHPGPGTIKVSGRHDHGLMCNQVSEPPRHLAFGHAYLGATIPPYPLDSLPPLLRSTETTCIRANLSALPHLRETINQCISTFTPPRFKAKAFPHISAGRSASQIVCGSAPSRMH